MIEHYEFCIDILVIINADDKLLIKEMSKKASCITISTSVHCTLPANKEKAEKKKKICVVIIKYIFTVNVCYMNIFLYILIAESMYLLYLKKL